MSGFTAAGISPTTVTTAQQAPLGFILTVPDGDNGLQEWIYVNAEDALAVGIVAMRKDAPATYLVKVAATSAPASRVVGVAQHAIGAGEFGFILRRGIGNVTAGSGTIDVNEGICVDATNAGKAMEFKSIAEAQDATSTEHGISGPWGFALADAAKDNNASCYIDCRG